LGLSGLNTPTRPSSRLFEINNKKGENKK